MWTDITRAKHARKGLRYSSDLTDVEWAVLEPLIPPRSGLGRPPKWSRRMIMDGLFYVLRSGLPWRMLPRDFPPVSTVQRYFYAWRDSGLWSSDSFSASISSSMSLPLLITVEVMPVSKIEFRICSMAWRRTVRMRLSHWRRER